MRGDLMYRERSAPFGSTTSLSASIMSQVTVATTSGSFFSGLEMARTVADCALMFNIMNGPHVRDPATISPKLEVPLDFLPVKGLRIALSYDLDFCQVHADVRKSMDQVVQALRAQGAIVEQVTLGWDSSAADALEHRLGYETGRAFAVRILEQELETSDYIRHFAAAGLCMTGEQYLAADVTTGRMYDSLAEVMTRYDALICPTMGAAHGSYHCCATES